MYQKVFRGEVRINLFMKKMYLVSYCEVTLVYRGANGV